MKSKTAILIQSFSVCRSEFEYVFPPGAIFRVLERAGSFFVMKEVTSKELRARRAELPC